MFQKLESYFLSDFNLKDRSLLFKRLLYLFLLLKCIYWLVYYDILFGSNSVSYTIAFDLGLIKNTAFLLYAQQNPSAGLWFIIPLILLCILNLLKLKIHFVSDFIIWLIVININNKIYSTLTGGDYLMNMLLFYNCFISDKYILLASLKNQVKVAAHNFGIVAVMIQVCLVYFFSAFAKLNDEGWLNGNAILMISEVNHFSLPVITKSARDLNWPFVFLNYIVLFYQALFPFVIWIKKIKKVFLVIGILMHLYIAFFMGLVSFGLIMILCYIYFWPRETKGRLEFH